MSNKASHDEVFLFCTFIGGFEMFVSKKKLNEMLEKYKDEGYALGEKRGYEQGYKNGLHVGLTQDKKGILLNQNGIYTFEDNEETVTLN